MKTFIVLIGSLILLSVTLNQAQERTKDNQRAVVYNVPLAPKYTGIAYEEKQMRRYLAKGYQVQNMAYNPRSFDLVFLMVKY